MDTQEEMECSAVANKFVLPVVFPPSPIEIPCGVAIKTILKNDPLEVKMLHSM